MKAIDYEPAPGMCFRIEDMTTEDRYLDPDLPRPAHSNSWPGGTAKRTNAAHRFLSTTLRPCLLR